MSLIFPNVELLGLNQEARFFDHGTNYSNIQRINLRGNVIDLIALNGITGIWSGSAGLINTLYQNTLYQDLIINGYEFGTGRVLNMNFSPELDVQTKTYTASLLVYNSGNLFSFTGTFYSGIPTSGFQYLQEFNENYNFVRKQNLGYSYSHSANITFNSGIGDIMSIPQAQNLVSALFTGANLGVQFYSGFTNVQGKRFYTEAYDLISNACSFNETFDFDDYDGNGSYSATRINSFELAQNGAITVTEVGTIRGILFPTYQAALQAIAGEMTGTYFRCSGLFNLYAPSGSTPFINSPITQGRTFDLFNNVLNYTIVFSNKPNNFGPFFWDYVDNIQRSEGMMTVVENGTIRGKNENRITAYSNAYTAWTGIVKPQLYSKVGVFYSGFTPSGIDPNLSYFLDVAKETYSPYKSQVAYNYEYTNEQFLGGGTNGVKKIYVDEKDTYPLYNYNKINVFNVDEIAQPDYQAKLGIKIVNFKAIGERITKLTDYFPSLINGIALYVPTLGGTYALRDLTYSYTPDDNELNLNVSWQIATQNSNSL